MLRVRIVRAAEYICDIGTQSNPSFVISLPLSFSPPTSFSRRRGARKKRECRDRSKGHRVPPDRFVLLPSPSPGLCHFFSLFAFQLTLLLFPAGFLCGCVIAADAREILVAPCWERPCHFFSSPTSLPARKKIARRRSFSFLTHFVMHWGIRDTVSREGCVTDQSVACRAFITPRHIALFFHPCVI